MRHFCAIFGSFHFRSAPSIQYRVSRPWPLGTRQSPLATKQTPCFPILTFVNRKSHIVNPRPLPGARAKPGPKAAKSCPKWPKVATHDFSLFTDHQLLVTGRPFPGARQKTVTKSANAPPDLWSVVRHPWSSPCSNLGSFRLPLVSPFVFFVSFVVPLRLRFSALGLSWFHFGDDFPGKFKFG